MRQDLARGQFSEPGNFEVRDVNHPEGANYLEFLAHTNAVVKRLIEHAPAPDQGGIHRTASSWRAEDFKFVCIDLETGHPSVVPGSKVGAREIIFMRENRNHFIPIRRCHVPDADLLPWSTYYGRKRKHGSSQWPTVDGVLQLEFDALSGAEEEPEKWPTVNGVLQLEFDALSGAEEEPDQEHP